jgi:hypothetical protein
MLKITRFGKYRWCHLQSECATDGVAFLEALYKAGSKWRWLVRAAVQSE